MKVREFGYRVIGVYIVTLFAGIAISGFVLMGAVFWYGNLLSMPDMILYLSGGGAWGFGVQYLIEFCGELYNELEEGV